MKKIEATSSKKNQVDEKLMKPFSLGWKREVVRRVQTKFPNCDIYYFRPNGKKIRSLNEVKSYLTDGLTIDCFSFKREVLGVSSNFETVRDARQRKKNNIGKKKGKFGRGVKTDESQPGPSGVQQKRRKIELENQESGSKEEEVKKTEGAVNNNKEEEEKEVEVQKNSTKKNSLQGASNKSLGKKKIKKTLTKLPLTNLERKVLRKVMYKEMRQSRLTAKRKGVRKAVLSNNELTDTNEKESELKNKNNEALLKRKEKSVQSNSQETDSENNDEILGRDLRRREKSVQTTVTEAEPKTRNETSQRRREKSVQTTSTEADLKNKNDETLLKRVEKSVQSTSGEVESEEENKSDENESEESGNADLKRIVQKNIGKYRKLREKQKRLVNSQMKRTRLGVITNSRAESFLKNKNNYLKPLQKGWKRELVYRTNCSKAGLQADVYYYHPSGKKFRSSREISENLGMIGGLSVEFFTFRKEAVGCGEPQEVIRNARPQKH